MEGVNISVMKIVQDEYKTVRAQMDTTWMLMDWAAKQKVGG